MSQDRALIWVIIVFIFFYKVLRAIQIHKKLTREGQHHVTRVLNNLSI